MKNLIISIEHLMFMYFKETDPDMKENLLNMVHQQVFKTKGKITTIVRGSYE